MSIQDSNQYLEQHEIWDIHHSLAAPVYNVRRSLILKLLPRHNANKLCLDAGCGTGEYTVELLKRGFKVHSFDISEYAINKLESKLSPQYRKKFKGFVSNIFQFKSEEKYDFILLSEVLEHIKNDLSALVLISNLLKPSGKILITVPSDPKLWSEGDIISKHIRRYTRIQIRKLVKEAGLTINKFWIYGFPILKIWILIRKKFTKSFVENTNTLKKITKYKSIIIFLKYLEYIILFVDRNYLSSPLGVGFILLCELKNHEKTITN